MEKTPSTSALEHNIKEKGEFSYYYAHGRRFQNSDEPEGKTIQGPGIITGGEPILLEKTVKEVQIIKEPKKFTKYIFYDDDALVQIKIDLPEELKDIISLENVQSNFTDRSLDLKVLVPDSDPYHFIIRKFFKKIVPEDSKVKIVKGKICISLKKKEEDDEWEKLQG